MKFELSGTFIGAAQSGNLLTAGGLNLKLSGPLQANQPRWISVTEGAEQNLFLPFSRGV